jgi:ABC-type multidrug transport system fused ATPase/permease subunit
VASLLFKLYEPQKGTIYIDGHPLKEMPMTKVSNIMGIVMQEPALFNRSVF